MKNIISISLLCTILALITSCSREMEYDQPQYSSVVYLKNSGLTEVEFYNIGQDITYKTGIGRGGTNQEIIGNVTLVPFTPEELKEYNEESGREYLQIPAEYYTIKDTHIDFTANQEYADVEIVLRKEIGELEGGNYILPINLQSDIHSVNSNYKRLILHPNIVTPMVSFSMKDMIYKVEEALGTELSVDTYPFPIVLDYGDNTEDFEVYFLKNEIELSNLVDNYNAFNGTNYTLLPATTYSFDEKLTLSGGITNSELQVRLLQDGINKLSQGKYLLPIRMTHCELAPFDVNTEDVRYLALTYSTMKKITLNKDNIKGSAYRGGNFVIENMIDGNTGTKWRGHVNDVKEFDGQKCIYFDIDLKGIYTEIELSYYSYDNGKNLGIPWNIQVYASKDQEEWNIIAKGDDEINGFLDKMQNTTSPEGFTKLPVMNMGESGAKYIRICLMNYRWIRTDGTFTEYAITNGGLAIDINELEVRATPLIY